MGLSGKSYDFCNRGAFLGASLVMLPSYGLSLCCAMHSFIIEESVGKQDDYPQVNKPQEQQLIHHVWPITHVCFLLINIVARAPQITKAS